jgi:hypothetical protein
MYVVVVRITTAISFKSGNDPTFSKHNIADHQQQQRKNKDQLQFKAVHFPSLDNVKLTVAKFSGDPVKRYC